MTQEELKEAAKVFKALSDENRLKILRSLWERRESEVSVTELVETLGISQPLVSHHLKELRYAGIVEGTRQGAFIYYRVKSPDFIRLIECILSTVLKGKLGNEM